MEKENQKLYICNKVNCKWCPSGKNEFFCDSSIPHKRYLGGCICLDDKLNEHRVDDVEFIYKDENNEKLNYEETLNRLLDDMTKKQSSLIKELSILSDNIEDIKNSIKEFNK